MLCKKPYMIGVMPCGCGQCLPCRINRRRLWSHRMLLESAKHAGSSFVTLTYNQENVPPAGTLDPSHPQKWLKRLRKALYPAPVRFFLVGEYGSETHRPHYHCALFGVDQFTAGGHDGLGGIVKETWKMGHIFVGDLTMESAQYIAGYVTKKMTKSDDARLNGRYPEFARMSLRPGIGATAAPDIAKVLSTHYGLKEMSEIGDVPSALKLGNKLMPLGRYLRRRLRIELGGTGDAPPSALKKYSLEMRVLYEDALKDKENTSKTYSKIIVDCNLQKVLNLETRSKLYSSRGKL